MQYTTGNIQLHPREYAGNVPVYCAFDKLVSPFKLVENPRNPNRHPEEQIRILAEIIQAQGWRSPITISKRSGFIVRGHGRLRASLKFRAELVPVDYQDYENEASEWADLIADNRISELSEIDDHSLSNLISEISTNKDFNLDLTGFDTENIERLTTENNDKCFDVTDNSFDLSDFLEQSAFTEIGDIWSIGRHRLIVGDCTDQEVFKKLMGIEKADLCVTDPPYNVSYSGKAGKIKNDNMKSEDFYSFLLKSFKNIYLSLSDGAAFYCFFSSSETVNFHNAVKNTGFKVLCDCVWVKNHFSLSFNDYHEKKEPCIYSVKPKRKYKLLKFLPSKYAEGHESIIYGFKNTAPHKWFGGRSFRLCGSLTSR